MLTLTPAYGRDYKSAKAVLADWESGKDFRIATLHHPDSGRYCSSRDISEPVKIRYNRLTRVVVTKP